MELTITDMPTSWVTILARCIEARKQDEVIGFTNGCFDLLHVGHLTALDHARSICDFLVVGVNSDRWVREQKGADRPIFPCWQRMTMLQALRAVDAVVEFDTEDELRRLIFAVRPDALIKGHEYRGRDVTGAGFAEDLYYSPMIVGISTSEIIERVRQTAK